MKPPKLVIEEEARSGSYYIKWQFDDDDLGDDIGGYLGQSLDDGTGPAPEDKDAWEHWAACKAILEAPDRQHSRSPHGFYWESLKHARSALALIHVALRADKPLPAWAQTAIQNGWKAPKGWKP